MPSKLSTTTVQEDYVVDNSKAVAARVMGKMHLLRVPCAKMGAVLLIPEALFRAVAESVAEVVEPKAEPTWQMWEDPELTRQILHVASGMHNRAVDRDGKLVRVVYPRRSFYIMREDDFTRLWTLYEVVSQKSEQVPCYNESVVVDYDPITGKPRMANHPVYDVPVDTGFHVPDHKGWIKTERIR